MIRRSMMSAERRLTILTIGVLVLGGCSGGGGGGGGGVAPPPPPPPPAAPRVFTLTPGQELPGLVFTVVDVEGGTGPGGNPRAGDQIAVRFSVAQDDGTPVTLSDVRTSGILLAGPTYNYQLVVPRKTDLATASVDNGDGTYTYTFADPLPATYPPPLNDTTAFGAGDGELQGQPLDSGTYTIGLQGYVLYQQGTEEFRDGGALTHDLLFGNATSMEAREVVLEANCAQCHTEIRAHGETRRTVQYCLLCHTSGAEDRNTNGATPGASVDFRVMIHKIHNGAHLPSVNGVTTDTNGVRDYTAPPTPYELVGFNTADFSHVAFPIEPNLSSPMPRDAGYAALTGPQRSTEDAMRRGVTSCDVCHGDPDGNGPLAAPAQGNLAYENPTRRACGSCHDDVVWEHPYTANFLTMPPQLDDTSCSVCHPANAAGLGSMEGHLHPLLDPAVEQGLRMDLLSVMEAGAAANGNGRIDPGEKVRVQFTITNDAGTNVPASSLSRIEAVISGPTSNYNLVLYGGIPQGLIGSGPVYDVPLPEVLQLEYIRDATATLGELFFTDQVPVWTGAGAPVTLQVRTATGAGSVLTAGAPAVQNFIDVADGSLFARNDAIVIDDGVMGFEEYMVIQNVEGNRLWFSSPFTPAYPAAIRVAHSAGASVQPVTLTTLAESVDYTLDPATGQITELTEFGAGNAVLISYTSDFIVPAVYGVALNGSPDCGEEIGEWTGKSLVPGTYTLGLWASRMISVMPAGETTTYRAPTRATTMDFLVGTATTIQPYQGISSAENCTSCHQDILFHGNNRRGFDSCILCHGTAGAEDRPTWVSTNSAPTTGTKINFRQMLHKIHHGSALANAETYQVVGFGGTSHFYDEVVFPAWPGGTQQCAKCHGENSTSWYEPESREHPTEQTIPGQGWRDVCSSCHDSSDALAHIEVNTTTAGAESCGVCHGPSGLFAVEVFHTPR